MMLGGMWVGVGMGLLLWWLEQSAYFDWGLTAMKAIRGVRFRGHLESGKPVNQTGLCEQVRDDFDSYLRTICVG